MKNINILSKLAVLKKEDCIHEEFSFADFNHGEYNKNSKYKNCKTLGCLAGELPGITTDWYFEIDDSLVCVHFKESRINNIIHLMMYFDLTEKQAKHLFIPRTQYADIDPESKILTASSTFEEVQANLQRFLTIKGIDYRKEALL
ncbi:MAG: hypothetical protein WAT71_12325 [Ignavibacteria bacterium]